ncbi:Rossmann-like and DUF2520 domain-containing protein [Dysgonomonas sp. 25]|uniref:Rossmann-like and DUF2520 domain-containing protein n=1 Tax=Dysgonomonas sp. 25 TaxID=2302933 RepID=UPI0013D52A24|nr:F420-dependent NADP oxidoreductase [Dysgonomonas sp. 25]NDV69525.1 DUF2520 domain-containing protein [Dysgonomonas sp. 25]
MKIIFVGAGNVATHLARGLSDNHQVVQVYSRTVESAEALASLVGAEATTDIKALRADADIYIFSVKDAVLQELIASLPKNGGIWLHTAGSMPMALFEGYAERYGVLYPFQTFTKGRSMEWKDIPFFIEASDRDTYNKINELASSLSEKVIELSSDKRKYLHLTGVFACNFVNYMYTLSEETLQEAGLPFDVVLPLIDETCAKVHALSPADAQTGPAVRFDENVIDKHLSLISDAKTKELYRLISDKIYETHKNK